MSGLDVTVVLHRPVRAANVGATARAMKVMGFTRLILVAPCSTLGDEAFALAHGAHDVLAAATVVDSLDEALRGATLVVGTTARQGKDRLRPVKLRKFVSEILPAYLPARLAVVFGAEESGLSNQDLEHCQFAIEIPTGPLLHSLNLSQAVMVICYELFAQTVAARTGEGGSDPSSCAETSELRRERMEKLYRGLEAFLADVGYPTSSTLVRAMSDARRVLDTTYFTERDVNTLLGLFRHVRYRLRHPEVTESSSAPAFGSESPPFLP